MVKMFALKVSGKLFHNKSLIVFVQKCVYLIFKVQVVFKNGSHYVYRTTGSILRLEAKEIRPT
jgi:hypothetical protein